MSELLWPIVASAPQLTSRKGALLLRDAMACASSTRPHLQTQNMLRFGEAESVSVVGLGQMCWYASKEHRDLWLTFMKWSSPQKM